MFDLAEGLPRLPLLIVQVFLRLAHGDPGDRQVLRRVPGPLHIGGGDALPDLAVKVVVELAVLAALRILVLVVGQIVGEALALQQLYGRLEAAREWVDDYALRSESPSLVLY